MAKFCGKCGAKIDETTGLCPNCNKTERRVQPPVQGGNAKPVNPGAQRKNQTGNGSQTRIGAAAQKWAASPETKKQTEEKPKKKKHTLALVLLLFVLLLLVAAGITTALAYFDVVDIPILSDTLDYKFPRASTAPTTEENTLYVPEEGAIVQDEKSGTVYINNIVLIFFKQGTSDADVNAVVSSIGGKIVGSLPGIDQYQVKVKTSTLDELKQMCAKLKENDSVLEATYDTAFAIEENVSSTPNDPWGGKSTTGLWKESNPGGNNWWAEAVHAQSAWKYNDKMGKITVGIVDSGFDTGHQDLKNVIKYVSPINNKGEHGTHVAGIIGAQANNKKGITGLVWNCDLVTWDWKLNTMQEVSNFVFQTGWSTTNQILAGTVILVEKGAKVINLSAGQTSNLASTTRNEDDVDSQGHIASLYLSSLLSRGYDFVIVQSAGNGNSSDVSVDARFNGIYCSIDEDNCFVTDAVPAQDIIDRIIVVGAAQNDSNNKYSQPYWSNAGDRVDICAPGEGIYSTVPGGLWGKYAEMSGTSMAAPIVTGVAAMAWAANPSLTGAEVKKILCAERNTSYEVADNTTAQHPLNNTYRMVDANLAVKAAINYVPGSYDTVKGQFSDSDVLYGAVKFNDHWYKAIEDDSVTDWETARQYCIDHNGYLATITSAEEDAFIYNYLRNTYGAENAYFGLTDRENEGVWQWANGEAVSYTNWGSGEPNGENSEEDYGMYYQAYPNGQWNDGDFSYGTVNGGTIFICEWGKYEVTPERLSLSLKGSSGIRDIVLVLDTSDSMSGTPISETKNAATRFIETTLEQDASIGIVTYSNSAEVETEFTADGTALKGVIDNISTYGRTNIDDGLSKAEAMLSSSNAEKKIIILMSDGEPNEGRTGSSLISYADSIREKGISIYTLGFFEDLSGSDKSEAQSLMEQIANDGCHYEVDDADSLVYFFSDIADQINGQKYIYIRIACPVDVTVTSGGETLCSVEENQNTRTQFGTLTFEENDEDSDDGTSRDNRIKVLRLKDGTDYDIRIEGNGRGRMNYTIGFMDENGEYSDLRKFNNIRITRDTVIDTVASNSDSTILNVDEDGNGRYDLKYKAGVNGRGEVVDYTYILYIVLAVVLLLLILIVVLKIKKGRKKKNRA